MHSDLHNSLPPRGITGKAKTKAKKEKNGDSLLRQKQL